MRKVLFVALTSLFTSVALISCQKDNVGPAGPAGPTGPAGATGATGPQGATGNANVTVYNYGVRTSATGSISYSVPNMTPGRADSSFLLAYANPSTAAATTWVPVPGIGYGAAYETRYFFYQSTTPNTYTMDVSLHFVGSATAFQTAVTFAKFRIFVIPASTLLAGKTSAPPVDYSDYHAVCSYYHIPE